MLTAIRLTLAMTAAVCFTASAFGLVGLVGLAVPCLTLAWALGMVADDDEDDETEAV